MCAPGRSRDDPRRSRLKQTGWLPLSIRIALICFPLIFLAELPDKTMFANLLMATRGRASQVWLGAAAAFAVHVVIATTLGVALFAVLPRRAIDGVVAAMFLFGAVYAWLEGAKGHDEHDVEAQPKHGVVVTAFIVIFLAEWGDLTQVLTANLAAKYGSPLSVGVGAFVALLAVAAIAVASGQALLRVLNIATIRKVTAAVLLALSAFSLWTAVR